LVGGGVIVDLSKTSAAVDLVVASEDSLRFFCGTRSDINLCVIKSIFSCFHSFVLFSELFDDFKVSFSDILDVSFLVFENFSSSLLHVVELGNNVISEVIACRLAFVSSTKLGGDLGQGRRFVSQRVEGAHISTGIGVDMVKSGRGSGNRSVLDAPSRRFRNTFLLVLCVISTDLGHLFPEVLGILGIFSLLRIVLLFKLSFKLLNIKDFTSRDVMGGRVVGMINGNAKSSGLSNSSSEDNRGYREDEFHVRV
jgi:hypothetical protein